MTDNGRGGTIEEVLREALQLGEQGRWEEMAELLGEALEDADDDPYLLCWMGVAEGELGNDGASYEAFRRCVDEDPSDPHILALAGAGLAQFDDPDAETALRAAALSAPDLPLARLNYGAYLARAGMHEEALEQLRAARDLTPDDPVIRAELGAAHVLSDEHREGLSEFEEALALAPEDSWTRVLYGLVLLEAGEGEQGAEELVRAAQEREHDAEAIILGALASSAQGWDDAAEDLLARAEFVAQGADLKMIEEAEAAIHGEGSAAERMLRTALGPRALRERLQQPL